MDGLRICEGFFEVLLTPFTLRVSCIMTDATV